MAAMAAATSRRKQADSAAAAGAPTIAASRVFTRPGCGALHMIPTAAVISANPHPGPATVHALIPHGIRGRAFTLRAAWRHKPVIAGLLWTAAERGRARGRADRATGAHP